MKGSLIIIGDVIFLGVCPPAIAFAREKTALASLQLIGSDFRVNGMTRPPLVSRSSASLVN
jgi:hypothetical protein